MIGIAKPVDLVEGFDSHGARIHAQASAHIARNPFHPLKTTDAGRGRRAAQRLEAHTDSGPDRRTLDGKIAEHAATESDDNAAQTTIPDDKIRSAADDHKRKTGFLGGPH